MTSPAAARRLAAIVVEQAALADRQSALAAEAAAIVEQLAGLAPGAPPEDRWITTKQAMRLAAIGSNSTIYRWADEFGLAERREGGRRLFSEGGVRALAELRASGRLRRFRGENNPLAANLTAGDGEDDRGL